MIEQNMVHEHRSMKCICWTAIFMGALVALGLDFLLNLFGIAIGLSAYTFTNGADTLAVGGFLGILVGIIVSMFVAGYTAGYLGSRHHCTLRNYGILYGFNTWVVALILSAALLGSLGHYVTSYTKAIGHTVITTTPEKTTISTKVKPVTAAPAQTTTVATEKMSDIACTVFVMFFIGAFFSCLGGFCGMGCKRME